METNRKNRSGINIWVLKHCNWSEKGWCCSTSIRQGSRRGIQETAWNVWGEDCNMDYQSSMYFVYCSHQQLVWRGAQRPFALQKGARRGDLGRAKDRVISKGAKKRWSQWSLVPPWRGYRQSNHWLWRSKAKCSRCPFSSTHKDCSNWNCSQLKAYIHKFLSFIHRNCWLTKIYWFSNYLYSVKMG